MYKILFIFVIIILISGCTDIKSSPTYMIGYDNGYSEHNTTKYNICVNYTNTILFNDTDKNITDFARGYKHGYEQYQNDFKTEQYENDIKEMLEEINTTSS